MKHDNATVLLSVNDVKVAYGGIQAVKGVSLEVREGELVSLIGSNGAGKTTTMKAITRLLPLGGGRIELAGKTIDGQGPWDLVQQGLAMVPANWSRRSLRRGKVANTRSMSSAIAALSSRM